MDPYKVTMEKRQFGRFSVEVFHDLAWACIFVNRDIYEAPGNTDGKYLNSYHEEYGVRATPFKRLLQMIRLNRNPDDVPKDEAGGLEYWVMREGRPIAAAYRDALARAKWFWDHPVDLEEHVTKEVVGRWKDEKDDYRKMVLQTFIPKPLYPSLGIKPLPDLQSGLGKVLEVPFQ